MPKSGGYRNIAAPHSSVINCRGSKKLGQLASSGTASGPELLLTAGDKSLKHGVLP